MKEINLTSGYVALISDEDFEQVSKIRWRAVFYTRKNKRYVYARHFPKKGKPILLHVFLFGLKANNRTVFLDGNSLNFQRENIKIIKFNHEQDN